MSLTSLIPTGGEFCVLRAQVVDSLLACCDGDSALLYLYLVRKGSSFDEREALRALDMAGRDPAPEEYRYLSGFIRQGFDAEAVELAKERMYARLGKFSWKYLKGILDSWHQKGVHTAAEITAVEPGLRQPQPAPQAKLTPPSDGANLSDWERDWLEEFNAMNRKEGNSHGV